MREYEGVCYDGPFEGEHVSQPHPWHRKPVYRPLRQPLPYGDYVMPEAVFVEEYRWSRPLRKWVWVQR